VVVTTEFLHEANMQRDALGMPDLVPVVIDHPLSTLADEQITARAEQAMVQCVATWTGTAMPPHRPQPAKMRAHQRQHRDLGE
jgi:hypothetical protein